MINVTHICIVKLSFFKKYKLFLSLLDTMEKITKIFSKMGVNLKGEDTENSISILDVLPEEILEEIFILIPANILCKTVSLVCKQWCEILERDSFWVEKGIRDEKFDTRVVKELENKGIFDAKKFYFNGIFNTNLLKNPCGKEGFDHWIVPENYFFNDDDIQAKKIINNQMYDGYAEIEEIPIGLNEQMLDKNGKEVSAFVTSYIKGELYQVIDFQHEDLIEKLAPEIEVKENYTERFDCASEYGLKVYLVGSDFTVKDKFVFSETMPQWGDAKWKLVQHSFKVKYPVRYLIFYHYGKDRQNWAGNYGSKMTNGSVKITI